MHLTKRDGLRLVTFTEAEFDVIRIGFDLLYDSVPDDSPAACSADAVLVDALMLFAMDDSDLPVEQEF